MSVLLLRLAAPLQSWGVASRFVRRDTQQYPSKSGVLGLIAAAQGRRRTDPIEDELVDLAFGVRIDQHGTLVRDFQTAVSLDERTRFPLSQRYYIADAVFVAAIQGDEALLRGVRSALLRPEFPLYLGRRSCPADGPVVFGDVWDATMREALHDTSTWQAGRRYRYRQSRHVRLPIFRDVLPDDEQDPLAERVRDVPVSFDPVRREYGWRTVVSEYAAVDNVDGRVDRHDPFSAFGGA